MLKAVSIGGRNGAFSQMGDPGSAVSPGCSAGAHFLESPDRLSSSEWAMGHGNESSLAPGQAVEGMAGLPLPEGSAARLQDPSQLGYALSTLAITSEFTLQRGQQMRSRP
jgi:hypothetical protein